MSLPPPPDGEKPSAGLPKRLVQASALTFAIGVGTADFYFKAFGATKDDHLPTSIYLLALAIAWGVNHSLISAMLNAVMGGKK